MDGPWTGHVTTHTHIRTHTPDPYLTYLTAGHQTKHWTSVRQQILVPGFFFSLSLLLFDLAMLSQPLGELAPTEPRTGYCFMFVL